MTGKKRTPSKDTQVARALTTVVRLNSKVAQAVKRRDEAQDRIDGIAKDLESARAAYRGLTGEDCPI